VQIVSLPSRRVDPHHINADPDPAFHFNAVLDPEPAFHLNADPDPTFHFNAAPDQLFTLMRSAIRQKHNPALKTGKLSKYFGLLSFLCFVAAGGTSTASLACIESGTTDRG
jgi:hypothetical protein